MKLFVFLFHTRQLSTETKTFTNPFTGESETVFQPQAFSDREQAAIEAFWKQHKYEGPQPEGEGYFRRLFEKENIRMRGLDMQSGVSSGNLSVEVIASEMSEPLREHFFELMQSANLAMMSDIADNVLVLGEEVDELTRQQWPDVQCIPSEKEFHASFADVYSERDVVV